MRRQRSSNHSYGISKVQREYLGSYKNTNTHTHAHPKQIGLLEFLWALTSSSAVIRYSVVAPAIPRIECPRGRWWRRRRLRPRQKWRVNGIGWLNDWMDRCFLKLDWVDDLSRRVSVRYLFTLELFFYAFLFHELAVLMTEIKSWKKKTKKN